MKITKLIVSLAMILGLLLFGACSSPHDNLVGPEKDKTTDGIVDDLDDLDNDHQTSIPLAPTDVRFTEIACDHLKIDWTYLDRDADGMVVQRRISDLDTSIWEDVAELDGFQTEYPDADIEPGTNYIYRVKAVRDNLYSAYSNECQVQTATEELDAPEEFKAEFICGDGVHLSWIDNVIGESGYVIMCAGPYISGSEPFWSVVDTVEANSTEYVHNNSTQMVRLYRIFAINACTSSNFALSETVILPQRPLSPTQASASIETLMNYVRLNWQDNSTNEGEFVIYRSVVDPFSGKPRFEKVFEVDVNETTFLDKATATGKTYIYHIYSQNCAGRSIEFAMVKISIPIA